MLTREQLSEYLFSLKQWVDDWAENVNEINEEFLQRMVELSTLTRTMDVEPDAWELVMACDAVMLELNEWATEAQIGGSQRAQKNGSYGLWNAWKHVFEWAIKWPKYPTRIESVLSLHQQQIPHEYIAKMYGWRDDLGNPDTVKVAKELREPGSQLADWVNPAKIANDKKVAAEWAQRQVVLSQIDQLQEDREPEPAWEWKDAPETIEMLLLEEVPTAQIMKMKRCTMDDIRAAAVTIGKVIDGETALMLAGKGDLEGANVAMAKHLNNRAAQVDTYPELDSIEDQIWAMTDDGHTPAVIVRALRVSHDITYAEVVSTINRKPRVERGEEETQSPGEESGAQRNLRAQVKDSNSRREGRATTKAKKQNAAKNSRR